MEELSQKNRELGRQKTEVEKRVSIILLNIVVLLFISLFITINIISTITIIIIHNSNNNEKNEFFLATYYRLTISQGMCSGR